jgi:hypothetical protein
MVCHYVVCNQKRASVTLHQHSCNVSQECWWSVTLYCEVFVQFVQFVQLIVQFVQMTSGDWLPTSFYSCFSCLVLTSSYAKRLQNSFRRLLCMYLMSQPRVEFRMQLKACVDQRVPVRMRL